MPDEKLSRDWTVSKIVLIYILPGCIWILLSDRLILWLDGNTEKVTLFQTYKGWFFILATGLLLYFLIYRGINSVRRNEREKREVGEKYRNLVENANDVIYELDEKGKFISINRAGELVTGYTKQEILEKNLAEIIAPKYQKYIYRLSGKVETKKNVVYEIELIKKDNQMVYLEINTHPRYLNGKLVGMQGIARDLTARRLMEIKLREIEHQNRTFTEIANEGILIIDSDGIVTFANEKIAEILDYDLAEIIDNYIFDFMDKDSEKSVRQKLEIRKAGIKETYDLKFKTFDGKSMWFTVSAAPIFENDEFIGSIAMIADITERKKTEDSLKNEQQINNATIASLPGIFYFFDEAGKFLRWNHNFETISGYTGCEISQMHPLDFFDELQKKMVADRIIDVFVEGQASLEANLVSKNGSRKPFFFTGKRLILNDKKYLVGVGTDSVDFRSISTFGVNQNSDQLFENQN